MTVSVPGNAVVLLENGQEYFPALEASIDAAEREIFLQSYIFSADKVGRSIAGALRRAARRGVVVRVMVDGFGGRDFVRDLMPELAEAGVEVLIYRRELRAMSLRRHRLRRLHRKVVTIDGREAYVGGINITDDFTPNGSPFPRYDYAVRVQGPVLEPIVESAHRLWRLVAWASFRRRVHQPLLAPPRGDAAGAIRAAYVVRDNLRYRRAIEDAYLAAIGRARSEIVIANAYFFPGRRFRQALAEAAQRGVRVMLLLQGAGGDHPLQVYATRALYPFFLQRGVELYEYHRSHLHAKVAVVDGCWATVGSSNIDVFSLLLAREANVVIEDEGFAVQLRHSLAAAMRDGAEAQLPERWRRLPLMRRMANWLAYQVVRMAIGIAGYGGKH
ncbi:cardiolipin synthase ClsB [Thauera sinica]|uniref:Cardiolipin synthase B n=1 Tax=Thauera sinica TaxID=2665146 RepID=A0ABW1ATT1_9RHOO|nr:cardiolipin synthase ClsB [Thauera sp. K11]ATE58579.1 cardiolipin synthase ClsB [Thauera sp. K11]